MGADQHSWARASCSLTSPLSPESQGHLLLTLKPTALFTQLTPAPPLPESLARTARPAPSTPARGSAKPQSHLSYLQSPP